MIDLVVETGGGVDRLRDPVDHDVGEQFVFTEGSLNVALAIAPGAELFDDPACQACGRVIESIGKRLGACALDTAIRSFVLLVVLPLCAPLLYFRTVAQALAFLHGQPGGYHVQVDADQMLGVGIPQAGGDRAAPIASLRSEALIAQFVAHQVHEKLRDTSDVHASFVRALRETIAGQRGDYDIKCVLLGAAMTDWIGERPDNLVHFKKGAGPAMRDNQRHGMWSCAFDMQKEQTKAVNGGLELWKTVQQPFLRAR